MPQKVWTVGEEVLAADFNTYVQNQVVPQFPNTAARDTWAAPPNGAMSVTTDTNTVWVRRAGAWVWMAGPQPFFKGSPTGTQSANTGAGTVVQWGGTEVDADNVFNGATGVFTCPAAFPGRWRFDYSIRFGVNGTGVRNTWIDGVGLRWGQMLVPTSVGEVTVLSGSAEFVMSAGQSAQCSVYHNAGAALQLNATASDFFAGRYVGAT